MLSKRILTASCALALLGLPAGECGAQQLGAAAPSAPASSGAPEQYKLDLLIRTTIIAINQANMTGNYTVFRDLTSPVFQSQNSPARLAEIFSTLRKRNLDLSPVIFFPAKFQRPPAIENGMLHATGYFPTKPEQVNFDLAYQNVNGRWLLLGVSVSTAPNPAPSAGAAAPGTTAAAAAPAAAVAPAQPRPAKPKPARTAPAPKPGASAEPAIEPRTTSNFAHVDLPERRPPQSASAAEGGASTEASAEEVPATPTQTTEKKSAWPF